MKEKKIYLKPTIKTLEIDVSCCLLAGSNEPDSSRNTDSGETDIEFDAKVNFHFLDSDGSW